MTFRVTGKESLLGGPPPEDSRREQWIKERLSLEQTARGRFNAERNALRGQRVRQDFQARAAASNEQRAQDNYGLHLMRLQGRIVDSW